LNKIYLKIRNFEIKIAVRWILFGWRCGGPASKLRVATPLTLSFNFYNLPFLQS